MRATLSAGICLTALGAAAPSLAASAGVAGSSAGVASVALALGAILPEPGTALLLGAGLAGLAAWGRPRAY